MLLCVIHTASDDSCGGGLGTRLHVNPIPLVEKGVVCDGKVRPPCQSNRSVQAFENLPSIKQSTVLCMSGSVSKNLVQECSVD